MASSAATDMRPGGTGIVDGGVSVRSTLGRGSCFPVVVAEEEKGQAVLSA